MCCDAILQQIFTLLYWGSLDTKVAVYDALA
jgi:hypothetical protein